MNEPIRKYYENKTLWRIIYNIGWALLIIYFLFGDSLKETIPAYRVLNILLAIILLSLILAKVFIGFFLK